MSGPAEELIARIEAVQERRAQRLLAGEYDEMASEFYAEDARLLPPDQAVVEGIERIREFWLEAPESGLINLELECTHLEGSGEWAYTIGEFTRTVRPLHGHPLKLQGKYLVVYRLQPDGSFRAVAEIFNSRRKR